MIRFANKIIIHYRLNISNTIVCCWAAQWSAIVENRRLVNGNPPYFQHNRCFNLATNLFAPTDINCHMPLHLHGDHIQSQSWPTWEASVSMPATGIEWSHIIFSQPIMWMNGPTIIVTFEGHFRICNMRWHWNKRAAAITPSRAPSYYENHITAHPPLSFFSAGTYNVVRTSKQYWFGSWCHHQVTTLDVDDDSDDKRRRQPVVRRCHQFRT